MREQKEEKKTGNKFENKKIVLTGFRSTEISEFIEKNGGEATNSVSKNTSLVICVNENETSTKTEKAEKFNVPIITKEQFIKTYMKN